MEKDDGVVVLLWFLLSFLCFFILNISPPSRFFDMTVDWLKNRLYFQSELNREVRWGGIKTATLIIITTNHKIIIKYPTGMGKNWERVFLQTPRSLQESVKKKAKK